MILSGHLNGIFEGSSHSDEEKKESGRTERNILQISCFQETADEIISELDSQPLFCRYLERRYILKVWKYLLSILFVICTSFKTEWSKYR